jgi:hypothetical protein
LGHSSVRRVLRSRREERTLFLGGELGASCECWSCEVENWRLDILSVAGRLRGSCYLVFDWFSLDIVDCCTYMLLAVANWVLLYAMELCAITVSSSSSTLLDLIFDSGMKATKSEISPCQRYRDDKANDWPLQSV